MSTQTWAILDHYSSTIDKPLHSSCPKGETSWCSYQRDKATGKKTHQRIKLPLTPAIKEAVNPVFDSRY